jgi:hypothetical protein
LPKLLLRHHLHPSRTAAPPFPQLQSINTSLLGIDAASGDIDILISTNIKQPSTLSLIILLYSHAPALLNTASSTDTYTTLDHPL